MSARRQGPGALGYLVVTAGVVGMVWMSSRTLTRRVIEAGVGSGSASAAGSGSASAAGSGSASAAGSGSASTSGAATAAISASGARR